MSKFNDLTGKIFGNWKVLYLISKGTNIHSKWHCICLLCNREYDVAASSLLYGTSTKCRICATHLSKIKEYSGDPIKIVFKGMKQRCYNPNTYSYQHSYGSKGIRICDEWLNDPNIFYDWAYKNGYKKGMSIERKDNSKGYSAENCIIIPIEEQSKNRSTSYMITLNEKTQCLADWCKELNLNYTTILARINNGIDPARALYLPINYHRINTIEPIKFN